ncbi:MAG: 50S ribosomal protein L24 [archaeon]
MKTEWSKTWKSSIQPRKQRKYVHNANLHTRQTLMHTHLSKELKVKYGKRNFGLKVGDKVKVLRGQFKKIEGKVTKVMLKQSKVYIEGVETLKTDGSKTFYPLTPSNLVITDLNLNDKKRKNKLEKKSEEKKVEEKKK